MTRDSTSRSVAARKIAVSGSLLVGVTAVALWQRRRLPDLPVMLTHANWVWVGAAIVMQGMSVAALARMQRTLLGVAGSRHSIRTILATTYAGNAISQSLPVVGSAASAVFIYRRFVSLGVEKAVAAWVLTVSGVFSAVTFVAFSSAGGLATGALGPAVAGIVTLLVGVIPATALLVGLQRPKIRRAVIRVAEMVATVIDGFRRHANRSGTTGATEIIDQIGALRLRPRQALHVGGFAILNWSSDVACLLFALMAIGVPIPWHGILLAWAAGAGASSLGLTPGGLGVVESALSIGLIAAGVPPVLAISAVLLYRVIKLWMVVAAGAVTLLIIQARARSAHVRSVGSIVDRPAKAPVRPPLERLAGEAA